MSTDRNNISSNNEEKNTNNLLLQTILSEQRGIRQDVAEITKSMASKEALNDYKDEIKISIEDVKDVAKTQAEKITNLINAEAANTNFRKGFINGLKYVFSSIAVSLIGVMTAVLPSYFSHPNVTQPAISSQNTNVNNPVVLPTATPFKSMKLPYPP